VLSQDWQVSVVRGRVWSKVTAAKERHGHHH
jgi:hypothetical protein